MTHTPRSKVVILALACCGAIQLPDAARVVDGLVYLSLPSVEDECQNIQQVTYGL